MYKQLDQDNKSFTLIHCWNKLKDEDNWKTKRRELVEQEKRNKNKKQKVHAQSTPRQQTGAQANDDAPVQAQAEGALVQEDAEKRPPGQKKAKEALKRGGGEACMEALDKMWAKKEAFDREKEKKKEERYLASLELQKYRLPLEEKKVESDLMEKEDKIMSMDMTSSSLTPTQLQYYQIMQDKIVARHLSNQKQFIAILFESKILV